MKKLPTTLVEAIRYFSDPEMCVQYVAAMRWPDGPICPNCGGVEHSYLTTRRIWKCKTCKKQFSVKAGSIFEDSAIPLDKWLAAIWLIANAKNGISSHELGRSIGVTQKSAWFMLHRIRLAMQTGDFNKLDGEVEVDETYIGGKARNMHESVRARKIGTARGTAGKIIVAGMMEHGGKVRASVVGNTDRATLQRHVRANIAEGSSVYTDTHSGYTGLEADYDHRTVDHAAQYVNGKVHTNTIENYWSLLKRGLRGTYISVEPFHLFRYLDERAFTFNERHLNDLGRFESVLRAVAGKRLTWAELTGRL